MLEHEDTGNIFYRIRVDSILNNLDEFLVLIHLGSTLEKNTGYIFTDVNTYKSAAFQGQQKFHTLPLYVLVVYI